MARRVLPAFLLAALVVFAAEAVYESAVVDPDGWLHIKLTSGKEIIPPKSQGQVSFGDAWISPDGRTVGWLVEYPYPDAAQSWRGPSRVGW